MTARVEFPFGSAGAAHDEHVVSFSGPSGVWSATCDSRSAAVNEVTTALQLGDALAVRIERKRVS